MKNPNVLIKYSTEENDILNEFYLPVLSEAVYYKRAVGYFSSGILVEYMKSLKDLYNNNGTMQLIISPNLSNEDIEALNDSVNYEVEIEKQSQRLIEQSLLNFLESNTVLKSSAELFFLLIVNKILEVKIAIPNKKFGLFHEKIGVFGLRNDNKIAIIGSNNETFRSLNVNNESFNTFCSWKIGQEEYVIDHEKTFDNYWKNRTSSMKVLDINSAFVNEVFQKIENNEDIDSRFRNIVNSNKNDNAIALDFEPFDYQERAATLLLKNRGGILEFATGSGKTKTAIYFLELLKKERSKSFFVIALPDKTLLEQWALELKSYNDNVLKCYSDNHKWLGEFRTMIDIYNSPVPSNQVVLVTNQTMFRNGSNSKFLKQLAKLNEDFVLIVDEIHNWSTELITSNLPEAKYLVGLSATPFNSPKTYQDKLLDTHFKGIVATYDLKDAISDKKLVPYNYYPIFVELNDNEKIQYRKLSSEIAKLQGVYEKERTNELKKSIELKRFERTRIVYGASEKISTLIDLIQRKIIEQDSLLIYCGATDYYSDDEDNTDEAISQLQAVNKVLNEFNIVYGQYTQKETSQERRSHLDLFASDTFSTLVAIKCLDEGVDIPKIKNAVILASSSNKREFIQRRGRVLRKSPGKEFSNIFDMVVLDKEDLNSHLNKIERTRVVEFSKLALNSNELFEDHEEYYKGEIYNED